MLRIHSHTFCSRMKRRREQRPGKRLRVICFVSKAPEGWRTPGRFARFVAHPNSRERPGVRRPSAAFVRCNTNKKGSVYNQRGLAVKNHHCYSPICFWMTEQIFWDHFSSMPASRPSSRKGLQSEKAAGHRSREQRPGNAFGLFALFPKRQRAGALQDASRDSWRI